MPFFEVLPEEQLPPGTRECFDLVRTQRQRKSLGAAYHVMALCPTVLRTVIQALDGFTPVPSRFGASEFIAGMLISHARRCRGCFAASRGSLVRLGFDDTTPDSMCQAPTTLPLPERERRAVDFIVRVGTAVEAMGTQDFHAMAGAGFAKDGGEGGARVRA